MAKRLLLLTGNPGIGKTTVLLRIVEALKTKDFSVGGMISREVRSCGVRVGFQILDLGSSRKGWLAHVNQESGPQVGRYRVNMEDLENLGVNALLQAVESFDVVAIDEIGPMELFSEKFVGAVRRAVDSEKLVVGVVHWKARSKLANDVKQREDTEVFLVTQENRDSLPQIILERAAAFLGK